MFNKSANKMFISRITLSYVHNAKIEDFIKASESRRVCIQVFSSFGDVTNISLSVVKYVICKQVLEIRYSLHIRQSF